MILPKLSKKEIIARYCRVYKGEKKIPDDIYDDSKNPRRFFYWIAESLFVRNYEDDIFVLENVNISIEFNLTDSSDLVLYYLYGCLFVTFGKEQDPDKVAIGLRNFILPEYLALLQI